MLISTIGIITIGTVMLGTILRIEFFMTKKKLHFSLKGPGVKVSNGAKIRNRYNQVPHLTQDTNGKVTN